MRITLLLLLLFSICPAAVAAVAEVVWAEFDGEQHHVLLSRFNGEAWSEPAEKIYSSDNPLTTPVLGSTRAGGKILVWAESIRSKVVLMIARASADEGALKWQPARKFSDRGMENLGPVIATDLNGHVWLFWSSSTKMPSDLYYRKYDGTSWTEATRVNEANEVPDNGAVASVDQLGNVVVQWNTFDLDLGTYVLENKTYLVENLGSAQPELIDVVDPAVIPTPDFMPMDARSLLHFPGNLRTQNQVVGEPADILR